VEKQEVHALLVQISYLDQRIVDTGTVQMWWEILRGYDYQVARDVVPICFGESDAYLTPYRLVRAIKRSMEDLAVVRAKAVTYADDGGLGAPDNLVEITAFYGRLWLAHPWGAGERPDAKAAEVGWVVPLPRWGD
jgi:hypothetical protein